MKKTIAVAAEVLGAMMFGMLVGGDELRLVTFIALLAAVVLMVIEIFLHMARKPHPILLGLINFAFIATVIPFAPHAFEQASLANYTPIGMFFALTAIVLLEGIFFLGGYIKEKSELKKAKQALKEKEKAAKASE